MVQVRLKKKTYCSGSTLQDQSDEARTALNADLTEANKLVETDYTPASWEAFADAKEKAASMNSIYATAKNLMDAKAELKAAKDALVPACRSYRGYHPAEDRQR